MNTSTASTGLRGLIAAAMLARHLLVVVATVAMLVISAEPVPAAAQEHHHYKLIDLGTLGGPQSYFSPGSGNSGPFSHVLNERGEVAGFANTALPDPFPPFCFDLEGDCFVTHAFEAHGSAGLTDLGALPG
jgi:hypothetical protein